MGVLHSARHVGLTRKRVAAPVVARREVSRDGSTLGLFKTLDGLGCDSFIADERKQGLEWELDFTPPFC
jgi:hypothetical protein